MDVVVMRCGMCYNIRMKRKIYEKLLDWKRTSNGRSAVLIDGARRIGKSWIAEEFARKEYESYLLIDFSKVSKEVKGFFEDYLEKLDVFFMYLLSRRGAARRGNARV